MNTMISSLYNDFKGWRITEYLWLAVALAIISIASIGSSPLDFMAAITNVMCVILVAKGKISNFVWGLVGVLTYGFAALAASLWGNAFLNLGYYAVMQFYGMYLWSKNMNAVEEEVNPRVLSNIQRGTLAVLLGLATLGLSSVLASWNDPFPVLDAFTMLGSMVAMWLMVYRYAEQWALWIVINIATVYIWYETSLSTGTYALLAMWLAFLGNSVWGAYRWHSRSK